MSSVQATGKKREAPIPASNPSNKIVKNMPPEEFLAIRFSGLASSEQETAINWMRNDTLASVCTSDNITLTKLQHIVKANPGAVHIITVSYLDNMPVDCVVTLPRKLISFRTTVTTRELTLEQREAMAERLKKARNKQ